MDSESPHHKIARRRMLQLGAVGAGAGAFVGLGGPDASASGFVGEGTLEGTESGTGGDTSQPEGGPIAESVPGTVRGRSYYSVSPFDWEGLFGTTVHLSGAGARSTGSGILVAPVHLPNGAVIRDFHVAATNKSGGTRSVNLAFGRFDGAQWDSEIGIVDLPNGATRARPVAGSVTPHTVSLSTNSYYLWASGTSPSFTIQTVRIGYQLSAAAAASQFVPITPVRVFDSRRPAYSPLDGIFTPNTSRVIPVRDGHDSIGRITARNAIPAGATAVAYNLTAVVPQGPNFLSIAPATASSYTTSAISFPGGFNIANGGVVKLDGNRQVRIFAGRNTGTTHVVLDVTGYYT